MIVSKYLSSCHRIVVQPNALDFPHNEHDEVEGHAFEEVDGPYGHGDLDFLEINRIYMCACVH